MNWRIHTSISSTRGYERGFTMIEMMTVLAIIGVMSAIAVQAFTKNIRRARKSEVVADLSTIVMRENAVKSLRGQYASTTVDDNPAQLYPPHNAFMNGGSPLDVVAWDISDPGYTLAGASDAGNFIGGGAMHGFDAINFMPEAGASHCSYGVVSGVGRQGRTLAGAPVSVIPANAGLASEIFPSTDPSVYEYDWFYAIARCDLDHDGLFWDFTVSHADTNVVDASLTGVRAEY